MVESKQKGTWRSDCSSTFCLKVTPAADSVVYTYISVLQYDFFARCRHVRKSLDYSQLDVFACQVGWLFRHTAWCDVLCVCSGVQGGKYPRDATMKARTFVVRDFVIGTSNALVATVSVEGTNVEVFCFLSYICIRSRYSSEGNALILWVWHWEEHSE